MGGGLRFIRGRGVCGSKASSDSPTLNTDSMLLKFTSSVYRS